MGLPFLLNTVYLLPLTLLFLALAVGALAFRARRRRGYTPFAVGFVAAVTLLIGKFFIDSMPLFYGGIGLLFAASIWNSWPRKLAKSDPSAPTDTLYQIGSNEAEV